MSRQKDKNWNAGEIGQMTWDGIQVAVLMDIRDELKAIRTLAECYRVRRGLDALHSMGVAARRRRKAKRRVAK